MKKIIFLLFLVMGITFLGVAQYQNNLNASIFAGGYFAPQNINNQGHWYGIYLEYLPIKTPNYFSAGICAMWTQSTFRSNDWTSWYQGKSQQTGLGLVAGKYWEFFSFQHSAYLGANLMIRTNQDRGNSKSYNGEYKMIQDDLILSGELNFNLLKEYGFRNNFLNRSQIRLGWQVALNSNKEDYWNEQVILESVIWHKSNQFIEYKQSWLEFGSSLGNRQQIKSILGYQFYQGDNSSWLIVGSELAFKKRGQDDWLTFFCLLKKQMGEFIPHLNSRQIVFGVNFQPFNLRNY